ncbi:MAG TPA: DUF6441 family protein [Stellaceae bacterium]|jgi:hypothetical protein
MIKASAGWVGGRDVKTFLRGQQDMLARATRAGVAAGAEGLKTELRQAVQRAGLGARLGNAIGANVYPRDQKGSLGAAGFVFPRGRKAERIFDSFNAGVPIRGKNGNWLAIPTKNAYLGDRAGRRPTPEKFEQQTGIKLHMIEPRRSRRGRYALLVGESVAGRRPGRKAATKGRRAQGRDVDTLVFFILIPEARVGKRLSFDAIAEKWAARIPELIDAATPQGLNDGG